MDWSALEARTNAVNLAAFGKPVTLNGVTVQGDFCEPSQEVFLEGVSAVAGMPQLVVATIDVPVEPVGKLVVIDSKSYTVADVRPDGRGMSVLYLEVVL